MRCSILLCATSLLAMATPALAATADAQPSSEAPPAPPAGNAVNANPAGDTSSAAGAAAAEAQGSAITVIAHAQPLAPSSMPLNVFQPTSVIQEDFIANNIAPLASIDDIIKFQPSVWTENPNGPGIGKAETMEIRGFQDGQYNVTFDGIPFGDSQDLHHTTSSLFIAHALREAEIDRGPGTASTIGKATFGGTVSFLSKDPLNHFDIDAYGTAGSFNTFSGGGRVDTGDIGHFRMYAEGQHEQTDGYLTHSNEHRDNFIGKAILDLSPVTKITASGSWNHEFQYTTQGATLAEYAKYGDNYGLCANQAAMCYYGYQPSNYYTDFEYVRLESQLGPVKIDNQIYHNGFVHDYTESSDASDDNPADDGVTFYSATTIGKKLTTDATDIKGKVTNARVSAWGDTLRFVLPTPNLDVKWGAWFDSQHDDRFSYTADLSQDALPVTGKTGTAYSYNYDDLGTTWQPYLELDWRPLAGLSVTPGIKYTDYKRDLNALLNKTGPNGFSRMDYHAWQPSVAANYTIAHGWTAYAQVARGFLAPPIEVFQVQDISTNGLKPETTWNYQVGTVVHGRDWSLSADGYYIDFQNYLDAQETLVDGSEESAYVNGGGVIYKGLEFEGQYVLGKGLSFYGNASVNSAKYKTTHTLLEETPDWTAALGLIYENRHGPFFSIIGKGVGPRYGDDGAGVVGGDDPQTHIGTTYDADLAAGWHLESIGGVLRKVTASIKVGNLFNSHAITDWAGNQSTGNAYLYWRQPGRSFFFNLEGHL